ncbi:MAG TPA: helix-turn-helix domain-containing protein, partial [Planctomycetota bacterium]|nr:helix-turn-helix domain-containing protein [Planctomycetota bacterium]
MPKRDRRSEIMRAAERLFTSRQYHEISLDDVIRDARVGKGTIYRYFKNKEDLFLQTAQSGFDEVCEVIHCEVPGDASFERQLVSACRKISDFFTRRKQLFRMMQTEQARMFWRRGEVRSRWHERRRK